jgi:RHS repeat-associated protein
MGGVRKVITTNIGTAYTLTLNIDMGTAEGLYIMPRTTNGGNIYTGTNLAQVYVTSSGTHTVTFTASTSTTQLLVEKAGTVTQTFYIDNVKVEQSTPTLTSYPIADVVSAQHYYPFGSTMQTWEADGKEYAFGYSGKEKIDEVFGAGNLIDYGARVRDPRIGPWLGVDPLAAKYPAWSPYVYAMNTPISAYDPDGKRVYFVAGAGNDQDGWNYTDRFKWIFEARGISDFKRVNATHGTAGDISFTALKRSSGWETQLRFTPGVPGGFTPVITRVQDKQIDAAVAQVLDDLAKNPLKEGEQLNLTGYSYGSVLQAHVALRLADKGIKVDNLILVGSPISTDSDLFKELSNNKNIGQVIRHDIKNDKLSNPQNMGEFISGGIESSELGKGDAAPHFDLARPGKAANLKIRSLADALKEKGVY